MNISYYESPIGEMLLASDGDFLVGLWFKDQHHFADIITNDVINYEDEIIKTAKTWLDNYFAKKKNNIEVPIRMIGTPFQKEIWEILLSIPYGTIMTYGDIAKIVAEKRGIKRMSSQAIGQAVSRNHISLIVPCHRVIGSNKSLTGYAGGLTRKKYLLELENIKFNKN